VMKMTNMKQQSGVTLVVSLIILVSLTILGVTSMQNTRTEISMAGNLRESGLTFNAAEAGLKAAETFVKNSVSKSDFSDSSVGLFDDSEEDPDYSDLVTWDASQNSGLSLPHVYAQPKFIVKFLGDRSQNAVAAVNIGGYGSSQPGITVSNFRITAQGTGQSGDVTRYVQSYYGKEY
jgi:type IV pilus assembly protein PilX